MSIPVKTPILPDVVGVINPNAANLSAGASITNARMTSMKILMFSGLVMFTAYLMQRSVAILGLDLHHDTFVFDAARRLLNGELPFRDFFYQYNLGTVFFHALVLNWLGVKIASLKIVTAMVYALIAALIYACGAKIGKIRWALIAALVWSTLSPFYMPVVNGFHAWSTIYMMAAVMGGAFFLTLAIKGQPLFWAVLAGICFNLAFWFKQIAAIQIIAILVWIGCNSFRSHSPDATALRFRMIFLGISLGGLTSSSPFFFYLYKHSLFEDWLLSAFVFNKVFASSGESSSGIFAIVKNFFPVSRELGYLSVVWALLPICLIAIILDRGPSGRESLYFRRDDFSLTASLFGTLSIAGWIEYFPLAHSFHTQLFLAPVFVLLALQVSQIDWNNLFSTKGRWPMILLLLLTATVLFYQAASHIKGLRQKTNLPTVTLMGELPARGLRLSPDVAPSYIRFFNEFKKAYEATSDRQVIPMSVDPLLGLLPYQGSPSSNFKMGVNWTFPNEIVEPGFNERLAMKVADRKSPIYADSLIAIAGYMPVALLEMPSPLTAFHTLYVPSADQEIVAPTTFVITNEILQIPLAAFPKAEQSAISLFSPSQYYSFLKLDNVQNVINSGEKAVHLHVSALRLGDVPPTLSKLQHDYFLKRVPGELALAVADLYENKRNALYELKDWPIGHVGMLALAKFMLSQGKLFNQQNRPAFSSTLTSNPTFRPFFANIDEDGTSARVIWSREWSNSKLLDQMKHKELSNNYLAIPNGLVSINEEAVLLVQLVFADKTTRNFYLHYQPK
jgi:hypothetical protein